jgi:hypothetical protein
LAGECKTPAEVAVSQRFLRVFATLLFTSNCGDWDEIVEAAQGGLAGIATSFYPILLQPAE